jgi:hypothetical protein
MAALSWVREGNGDQLRYRSTEGGYLITRERYCETGWSYIATQPSTGWRGFFRSRLMDARKDASKHEAAFA